MPISGGGAAHVSAITGGDPGERAGGDGECSPWTRRDAAGGAGPRDRLVVTPDSLNSTRIEISPLSARPRLSSVAPVHLWVARRSAPSWSRRGAGLRRRNTRHTPPSVPDATRRLVRPLAPSAVMDACFVARCFHTEVPKRPTRTRRTAWEACLWLPHTEGTAPLLHFKAHSHQSRRCRRRVRTYSYPVACVAM